MASLLAAKEEMLEHRLWSAFVAFEELAAFLEELQTLGHPYTEGEAWVAATDRVARLREAATTLRGIIERNAPIDLGGGIERDAEPTC